MRGAGAGAGGRAPATASSRSKSRHARAPVVASVLAHWMRDDPRLGTVLKAAPHMASDGPMVLPCKYKPYVWICQAPCQGEARRVS
jgi:hypothetical protein